MASNPTQKRTRTENKNGVNKGLVISENTFFDIGDDERLLRIFPEEIWLIITDKIRHSNEFENVRKASRLFWRITLHRAPEFKLFSVLDILDIAIGLSALSSGNVQIDAEPEENNNEENRSDKIIKQCRRDIFKLRLVCKNWCKAVDSYYQSKNCIMDTEYDQIFEYFKQDNLSEFLTHFASTHFLTGRNPFISRSVVICINDLALDYVNFVPQLERLLTFYGHHIWYLGFEFDNILQITSAHYLLMRNLLQHFPNLKELDITFIHDELQPTYLSLDIQNQLLTAVTASPFPKIESLKRVQTVDTPYAILCGICQTNKQIQQLEIFNRNRNEAFDDIHVFEVPNLQTLNLYLSSADVFTNIVSRMKGTIGTVSVELPLGTQNWQEVTNMVSRMWCTGTNEPILGRHGQEDPRFKSNETFSPTLEQLSNLVINTQYLHTNLANLEFKEGFKHFSIGTDASSDKFINLKAHFEEDVNKLISTFTLTDLIDNAYNSKIWQRLSKLENLIISYCEADTNTWTVTVHTRKGWERSNHA